MYSVALVLLAGGQSSRFGGNKLLSEHPKSKVPLIQHSLGEVVSARDEVSPTHEQPITVVTGKWHNSVNKLLANYCVSVVHNTAWEEGIASSIRAGVYHVLNMSPSHVLFTLADLPCLNSDDLVRLIEASKANPNKIVCSEWQVKGETNKRVTVPAIFPKAVFTELLALKGDTGAKLVIKKYAKQGKVIAVSTPNAQFDIDTPEDWLNLSAQTE